MGFHRLLHQLNIQPLLLHFVQDFYGLLGLPGLIGVDADDHVLAHGVADCRQPGHVQFRIHAHLHFQAVVAPVNGNQGVLHHGLRVVDGNGDIRHDLFAGAAHELVDGNLVKLSIQIPQGHIHSGLCAGVAHNALLHGLQQRLKLVHIPANNGLGDVILNGTDDVAGGVAGDGPGGRGSGEAHCGGVRACAAGRKSGPDEPLLSS